MVSLKYASKRIGEMNLVELLLQTKAMLSKIHVITGWVIPNKDEVLNILVDQFQKRLVENCSELNPDEIEYAFRQYGTTIEDWGKEINLNLLDKVLLNYIEKRIQVSKDEEKIKSELYKPEQKIFTQEELDDSAREDAERQYQMFLRGYELVNPEISKQILVADGLMKDCETYENGLRKDAETVIDFFKRRLNAGALNIYKK